MVSFLQENLWQSLLLVNYLLVIGLSVFIVLKNYNPTKTLSYIFALAAFPFLGLLVYYFFGIDYRKNKIFGKKYLTDNIKLQKWRARFAMDADAQDTFRDQVGAGIFKVYELLVRNQSAVLTFENSIQLLHSGEDKFAKLKEDIQAATSHIHLEYFVAFDDRVGRPLLELLCKRAEEGVQVRFIYDGVGSSLSRATKRRLTDSGVQHYAFMPVLFTKFTSKFNYRDHRKIVVIDGRISYVGGINIRQRYDNNMNNDRYWRDTHLRIDGPATGSLQKLFLLTWDFVSGNTSSVTADLFPEIKPTSKKPVAVQIAASGPDSDWANIMEAIFTAINRARKYIYITTPYMIPNTSILTALTTAARSGVDIRILIPYQSDSWAAQYATDSYIETLLKSGIRIFRYTKGFLHSKTFVMDDRLCSVGTANLDYRSFSINFEVNALLYDRELALELKDTFLSDLQESEEVEIQRWMKRGFRRKLQESVNRLWAPLL